MMAFRKKHFQVIVLNLKIMPLLQRLQILDDACNEIETYYHEYDFQGVPCNGFRSFVKIVDSYFASLATFSRQLKRSDQTIKEYDTLSRLLCNNAEAAAMIRDKGLHYPFHCTDADCEIMEKFVAIEPEHMEPLFANVGIFYVKRDHKPHYQQMLAVMHMMTASSLFQKFRMMISPRYRTQIQSTNAVSLTLDAAKSLRNMNQFPLNILLQLVRRPAGSTLKWISVPRDLSDWIISVPDVRSPAVLTKKSVMIADAHPVKKQTERKLIKTIFLKPKASRVRGNPLIIHIPGGAFITFTAKGYVPLMSRICGATGVAVLVPEYAKAPDKPYPAAIQDILDLYLFVTSGDQRVLDMLGFHPDNILLSGDSAGGQLATVLTIALNEIRKTGAVIQMPKALALQYAAAIPGFVTTPGATMSGLDTTVTIAFSRLTAALYAECEPKMEASVYQESHKTIINRFDIMKRFNDRLKDPFYNPLVYEHFQDFKEIPISILVCEMDSLIDHSIALANKWSGPVTLDVGRGLPHGFLVGRETPLVAEEIQKLILRLVFALENSVMC